MLAQSLASSCQLELVPQVLFFNTSPAAAEVHPHRPIHKSMNAS